MANKINLNLDFGNTIRLIFWIGLIFLMWHLLSGCSASQSQVVDNGGSVTQNANRVIKSNVVAMVVPHHLLVKSFMEKLYNEVSAVNSFDRVVIISPNHFGYGYNFIQTTAEINTEEKTIAPDALAMLKDAPKLDTSWIQAMADKSTAVIEERFFSREHGVYVQYPFIKNNWPQAVVVPVIIKHGTPKEKLDRLIDELEKLLSQKNNGKTLLVFSLDFTHYTGEESALKNDERTENWLNKIGQEDLTYQSAEDVGKSFDTSNADSVAVDSPESLYVMAKLMKDNGAKWNFWARTSSASMIKNLAPLDNTSHIFGYFSVDSL